MQSWMRTRTRLERAIGFGIGTVKKSGMEFGTTMLTRIGIECGITIRLGRMFEFKGRRC